MDNINQRIFYIPSSSSVLQVHYRPKLQWNSLNIHRFQLEFIHVNSIDSTDNDYFHCRKSGLVLPKQWKCNCLHECLHDDYTDEEDCPLCSMIQSSNSLLCHSNETWCLPMINGTENIEPKGNTEKHEVQCSKTLTVGMTFLKTVENLTTVTIQDMKCYY